MFLHWNRQEIINLKIFTLETWELKSKQTFDIHILVWIVNGLGKERENNEKIANKIMLFLINIFFFYKN
jgi:hypothetical protein